ncbi:RHS repeat-associated core domain-containing protein [Rathayibacter sp. YIM 133350]|uniref:RHS repeat-associated core domain-containing protein n=1 Tax=Rathayibacter sp. YIM 133350 TaxID=3131992 RepID=UPI00307D9BA5
MRARALLAGTAISALLTVGAVTSPAAAAPQVRTEALPAADVWTPPTTADDGAQAAAGAPSTQWAPDATPRVTSSTSANPNAQASPQNAPAGTTVGAPGLGSLPFMSFIDFPLSDRTVARVNVANGNLLVTSNDTAITGPGVGLRADRFYNGLSRSQGVFGGGWSSSIAARDVGLYTSDGGATQVFYGPSGIQESFTNTGTGYTTPAGFNAILKAQTGNPDRVFQLSYTRTGEELFFNGSGFLTADLDRNGVGVTYQYSGNAITRALQASGRYADVTLSGTVPTVITDSAGRQTKYAQTAYGQLGKVTAPDGTVESYTYDAAGRLSTITVPAAPGTTVVKFGYDSGSRVVSVTQKSTSPTWGDGSDIVTGFTYSTSSTAVADPNNHTSTYAYDTLGRVTSATDALNRKREQTWKPNSDVETTTDALQSGQTQGKKTTYSYDALFNTTRAEIPTGAAATALYGQGTTCGSAPASTPATSGTGYQPTCTTDPAGHKDAYSYDAAGNVLTKLDATAATPVTLSTYTYSDGHGSCSNYAGQICTATDARGKVTTYQYNAAGDLTKVIPPAPLGSTQNFYDTLGRLTTVIDGRGLDTDYGYSLADRQTLITFDDNDTLTTSYNPNGLRKSVTDSYAADSETYEYDAQGHLTRQGGPNSVVQKFSYDPVGNLASFQDGGGKTAYRYFNNNLLKTIQEPGGACPSSGTPATNSGCTQLDYYANNIEKSRVFPGGAIVTHEYDASGRPTKITGKDAAGTTQVSIGYSYTNGSADQFTLQTRTAFKEQGVTAGAVTTYGYDSQRHLLSAVETSGSTQTAAWTYTYDAAGNRLSNTRSGSTGATAGTISYTYNNANEIATATGSTSSWTYDAAGNQTNNGRAGTTQTVDDRGAARSIGGTAQAYFGDGNTERLSSGTGTFTTSALGLASGTDAGVTGYITRDSHGTPVSLRSGGSSHYYITDMLGSVVGLLSSTGAWEGGYSYSPYGEIRAAATTATAVVNKIRYTGGYLDTNSGYYKLGARYYDPTLGRFTQMDPSGQERMPYAYTQCNPVNGTDPTGTVTGEDIGIGLVSSYFGAVVGFVVTGTCFGLATGSAIPTAGISLAASLGCPALGAVAGSVFGTLVSEGAGWE